jgi:hypothetical protein
VDENLRVLVFHARPLEGTDAADEVHEYHGTFICLARHPDVQRLLEEVVNSRLKAEVTWSDSLQQVHDTAMPAIFPDLEAEYRTLGHAIRWSAISRM